MYAVVYNTNKYDVNVNLHKKNTVIEDNIRS